MKRIALLRQLNYDLFVFVLIEKTTKRIGNIMEIPLSQLAPPVCFARGRTNRDEKKTLGRIAIRPYEQRMW